jgi:hypothetical protein
MILKWDFILSNSLILKFSKVCKEFVIIKSYKSKEFINIITTYLTI